MNSSVSNRIGRRGAVAIVMTIVAATTITATTITGATAADRDLTEAASWQLPQRAQVLDRLSQLIKQQNYGEEALKQIRERWQTAEQQTPPPAVLDLVADCLLQVDPRYRQVVEFCREDPEPALPRSFDVLEDPKQPEWVRCQLKLLYGRWLAQHALYDEALEQLSAVSLDQAVDPAAFLFYQSVAHHRLLQKKECLPVVEKLLENEALLPQRFATVAQLIQADIEPLKTDSLDEISRMMDEIERRLGHARAGQRVRRQEDEVLKKLDKLIKKLEEQQQQASSSSSLQPSSPAQDSRPMGGTGPGNVDPKHLGNRSGWGNLPPKQRQEALQQIGKELPAHYREVIEEYFRKLAREGGK